MGKQNKGWIPPDDDVIVNDTPQKSEPTVQWMPPADDAVVEPVKKKEQPVVKNEASTKDSSTPAKPSSESGDVNKWAALGTAIKVISPGANMLYDFGRRAISGVVDDIPKAVAQGLEVAKSSVSPANVQEFIKTQRPRDFQKYVREKEGISWYEGFDQDKYIAKYADAFMADSGLQDIADRINKNTPAVIERRLQVEKLVQEQNEDSAKKLAGTVQDFRDIKSLDDALSFVGTMGGQAAYQIPLAIGTRGASSLMQESAAIYDKQLDNIAKDNNISREEVIKKNLDEPARGQAFAVLAAGLDAVSAGNILKVFRKGAQDGVLKTWMKSAVPEAVTEASQGVLETVGATTGSKLDALAQAVQDPDRVNEALGGLIGGSAGVFGASPTQTVQAVTENVDVTDNDNLAAKAEVIQNKVEQSESTVITGEPDVQPSTPISNVQTQEATTAVSEDQAKEEVQTQTDAEVSQAQDTGVTQNVTDINQPQTKFLDQDAVQEQSATEVPLREPSGDGQTVEQGNTEPQIASGESQQESPRQEEVQNESQVRQEEGLTFEKTFRGSSDIGGIKGVEPKNQFKLNQGANFERVQVVLDDAQAELYQRGTRAKRNISTSTDPSNQEAITFANSINQLAKENREKNKEVVLDFRKKQDVTNIRTGTTTGASDTDVQPMLQDIQPQSTARGTTTETPASASAQPARPGDSSRSTSPPVVPPGQATNTEQIEPTPEERTTYTRIKNDPAISDTIKQGIAQEAKTYVPRSLKRVTSKEADTILDAKGLDESTKMYLDDDSGIHPDVDTAIGIKLFGRLQTANNFTDAIRVFEKLSVRGTELGQAVNAYKLMQGSTMINVINKSITKARQKFKEKNEWRSQESKTAVDKINTEAVEKVLKSPKIQAKISSEIKKGSVKKAIDFLETLKVDTKGKALDAVYGISAAAWNTVITAVQKGLQAGLTISQAINKAVNSVKESDFEKSKATSYLDEQLRGYRVTLDPGNAIKEELKASGKKIDDIVRTHYSEQASTKKNLIDKLIKDANISSDQATAIADDLSVEFDRLTRAAKERALNKYLPKPSKNVTKQNRKTTIDELIEQSNVGALSEQQYSEAISDKLGVSKLSEEQLKEITDLTDKVQKAKGDTAKSKAAQDLLNYVENLKGWNWIDATQAIWYANILSGPTTWLVTNPFANMTNLLSELAIDVSQNPKDAAFIMGRVASGFTRGLIQAGDVLKTGYTPYKGEDYKTESKPLLERIEFKGGKVNPLNWLKYVTRAIKAGDILFYHPLKEQRLAVLALKEARKNKRTSPNKEDMHNLREQLIKEDYDTALEQASSEGFGGREQKIRAYEILEAMRPEFATKDAEGFAARATFNIKPEGTLGQVAEVINSARRKLPSLNYIVPFVNTIMNVANEYMNYNPVVGYTRFFKGSLGWNPELKTYRKLSKEESARIFIKATIGSLAMASLALLDDPDDEDNLIEITANGTGETQKNFELERSGWRPYSIRIGKTWIGYKNTPLALPLATVGFMKDAKRYRKDPNITEEMQIMAMGSMRFMMDMSTLSGLSDFFEIFSKENISQYGSSAEKLFKNLEKIAKSVIIPNYFTQMSRLVQEFTESPIRRADNVGESVIRDIPILRDKLGNLYDAFGDPVVPKQVEKFIPLNTHRTPADVALFEFLKDKKLFVGKPSPQNLKPNGTPMTEDEYAKWSLNAARATKARLKREYKMYSREKNREVINDWFDKVKSEERKQAKFDTFGFF